MTTRVVAAAILHQGALLVARRGPHGRQPGLWELPGGKVEAGEADEAALRREIAEELAIHVSVGEKLAEATHHYDHGAITLVAYACRWASGTLTLHDHDAVQWLTAAALRQSIDQDDALAWAPADRPLLPAVYAAMAPS